MTLNNRLRCVAFALVAFVAGSPFQAHGQGPKKVVVTGMAMPWIAEMQQLAPNVTFADGNSAEALAREAVDADAILGTITPELFQATGGSFKGRRLPTMPWRCC
jgi:hypothetical protein